MGGSLWLIINIGIRWRRFTFQTTITHCLICPPISSSLDQEFKGASQGLQQLVLDSHPNQEMADREGDLSGEEDGNENMPDEYPVNFRQGLFNDESEVCKPIKHSIEFFQIFSSQDVPIPMMMDYDMDPY